MFYVDMAQLLVPRKCGSRENDMVFSVIITFLFILSAVTLLLTPGNAPDAAMEGAQAAVQFCIGLAGGVCLWSGVMELAERCGITAALKRLLHPILQRLFPASSAEPEVLSALTENISANLLGLGNAATPAGIRAAQGMAALGERGSARDELCLLVVLNTASLQLLPVTVAALRAMNGAAAPFDIIPAVWLSSLASILSGLAAAALLRRLWR